MKLSLPGLEIFEDGFGGVFGRGRGGGGGYGSTPPSIELTIPAGAALRWPDGSSAGRVREATTLERPRALGEGHCVYVRVGNGSADLVLCFDPSEVELATTPAAK